MTDSPQVPTEYLTSNGEETNVDQVAASSQQVAATAHWRKLRGTTWARRVNVITTVLTALTAVAALILSLISTTQLNRRADMLLTMPNVIRFAQGYPLGGPARAEILIQPSFMVYQRTDITSVVTSVRLRMTPPPHTNSPPPYFFWADVVEYNYDTQTGITQGKSLSDPTPIVVTQDNPKAPILRFLATPAFLEMGRWKGTLTVERQGQTPLVSEFCIDISTNDVSTNMQFGSLNEFIMRNDQTPPSAQAPNCYRGA